MRVLLSSAALLVLSSLGPVQASDAPAEASFVPGSPSSFHGELAFSDTIAFDYDRDGTLDKVQFWIELKGQQAIGEPGSAGARPESGSVSYFVVDVASKRRIDNWLVGLNMAGGFPVAGQPYPLINIGITDRTARFELRGSAWTITDRGETWKQDAIEITTGGRKREGRFYGGDVTVTPGPPPPPKLVVAEAGSSKGAAAAVETAPTATPVQPAVESAVGPEATPEPRVVLPPADIKANSKCNNCHEEAAGTIAAFGGPHADLKCASCHDKHPRDVPDAKPACTRCHDSHDESMQAGACTDCHASHTVTDIQYGIEIPDTYCAACHKSSAQRLKESGTRHIGLACAICHRKDHGTLPACVDCHGAPHNKRMMSKPERCVACHESAHQTRVDR